MVVNLLASANKKNRPLREAFHAARTLYDEDPPDLGHFILGRFAIYESRSEASGESLGVARECLEMH